MPRFSVQFVLASESPRRVALLRQVGYDFEARKSGFPEVTLDDPRETVEANARGKALAIADLEAETVVLAADTIVYLPVEGYVLGQAETAGEVRMMLSLLQGRVHDVYSGVAVTRGGEVSVRSVRTRVQMRVLSEAEVAAYVALGEGIGKAGGYAIQGKAALCVAGIEGDYTNVVGLPLATTARMLEVRGVRWY